MDSICLHCGCGTDHHLHSCTEVLKSKEAYMNKRVKAFIGKMKFLSNFFLCEVEFEGLKFPSTEHAYQAAKTLDMEKRKEFQTCGSPGNSKRLARKLDLREDWEQVKLSVMENLLRQKFTGELLTNLKETTPETLEESNWWCDTFWGCCYCDNHNGSGENHLGKLLMKIRDENQ